MILDSREGSLARVSNGEFQARAPGIYPKILNPDNGDTKTEASQAHRLGLVVSKGPPFRDNT